VNKLVDLYSNMKPKQAADILGSLNEELAVEVLAKMKKKSAAEIMNLLQPEKAKILSEKYNRLPAREQRRGAQGVNEYRWIAKSRTASQSRKRLGQSCVLRASREARRERR